MVNNGTNIIERYNDDIDKVVTLTKWHKSNIANLYPIINPNKIEVINNGIDVSLFNKKTINKIKNKFIWSSCPERGLLILLTMWHKIIDKLPDATLDICSYVEFPRNEEDTKMLEIVNQYDSITYHGKINSYELYRLMSNSEVWLYTNISPETSCITAMELLMSESTVWINGYTWRL